MSTICLKTHVNDQGLTFTCVDNGVGIEEQVKPKIFNMFYRGSNQSKGSGLGLYVVKQVIDRLKGSIHVESIPGETSFSVIIPLPGAE